MQHDSDEFLGDVPAAYVCPITHEDPVCTADGHSFERKAIERWLTSSARSPLTNVPLPTTLLVTNFTLRKAITEYLARPMSNVVNKVDFAELDMHGEKARISTTNSNIRHGQWRGRSVTLLECADGDASRLQTAYSSLKGQAHIGRFIGVAEETANGHTMRYAVGESGPSLAEGIAYLHSQQRTLDMTTILSVIEQIAAAFEALVQIHIFPKRVHCNDILCLGLDDGDRSCTLVKFMGWRVSAAVLQQVEPEDLAAAELACVAEFAQVVCELCHLAAMPGKFLDEPACDCLFACPSAVDAMKICDKHIHVPIWPSMMLAVLASCGGKVGGKRPLCGVDFQRSCLNCSHPLCSRILRPCFVPEVHPRMTFSRLRVLLRAAGLDIAVQSALHASLELSQADAHAARTHLFAIHSSGHDINSLSFPSNTPIQKIRKYSWAPLGAVPTRRRWFACAVRDDELIIAGGRTGHEWLGVVESYAPKRGQWTRLPNLQTSRSSSAAVVLGNTLVMVGGHNADGFLASVEAYSFETQKWTYMASLPQQRFACSATLYRGQLCVIGGDDGKTIQSSVLAWNEADGAWAELPPLPLPRAACAVAAVDDQLVVIGGYDGEDDTDTVFIFDGLVWRTAAAMPFRSSWCTAARLSDGKVIVAGGLRGSRSINRTMIYDIHEGVWLPIRSLPFATTEVSIVALA